MKAILNKIFGRIPMVKKYFLTPQSQFSSLWYLRHNQRRLEHLASLNLDLFDHSVLEVGAGIGDHTSFFIDRGCSVFSTDARIENVEIIRSRFPDIQTGKFDLDHPAPNFNRRFDIVYCYGVLYHLTKPAEAIETLARYCERLLLLETCVSFGDEDLMNPVSEPSENPTQSYSGKGCRPTRKWVFNQLKKHFRFVYLPKTQPSHPEFPLDWKRSASASFSRAIFIASREKIKNNLLLNKIPMRQERTG